MLVLAIESSTSAAKAVLYDLDRGIVASSARPYGEGSDGMTDSEKVFSSPCVLQEKRRMAQMYMQSR